MLANRFQIIFTSLPSVNEDLSGRIGPQKGTSNDENSQKSSVVDPDRTRIPVPHPVGAHGSAAGAPPAHPRGCGGAARGSRGTEERRARFLRPPGGGPGAGGPRHSPAPRSPAM